MNISDLESDYINPIDGCKTLNQVSHLKLCLLGDINVNFFCSWLCQN